MRKTSPIWSFPAIALLSLVASTGCSTDTAFAPSTAFEDLYWSLRVDHHAVQLSMTAPGNTVQLTTTAYTVSGANWTPQVGSEISNVEWFSTDSSKVHVSSTGLVTAKGVTTGVIRVIARQRVDNVTRADTSQVRVATDPASRRLGSFLIQSIDSARLAMLNNKTYPVRAVDTAGTNMTGVVAYVTTSDTTIAKVSVAWTAGTNIATVNLTPRRPGTVLVTARAWVYGTAQMDTFTLRIGYPITGTVQVLGRQLNNGTFEWFGTGLIQEIGPGGIITWDNATMASGAPGQIMDVVFENPAGALEVPELPFPGSGDLMAMPAGVGFFGPFAVLRYRKFLVPGTYPFRILPFNYTGAIVVKPQ